MENKNQKQQQAGDELVTVAIHPYDRALILKSILESEGIPAVVHGVRMIQPVVPGNARVRIKEEDLTRALNVIEKVDFSSYVEEEPKEVRDEILIPVDFSNNSLKACEFGFKLAHDTQSTVKLLNAFFTPFYPSSFPYGESFATQVPDTDLRKELREKAEKEMKNLIAQIGEKISLGSFPSVSFSYILVEGLPEEEVISYSKKQNPKAIVMGTKGKSAKELDIIGSVTAEVIDGCRTPIFAVPEESAHTDMSTMKNILFLTNFQEREFKAFEIMMTFLKSYNVKVFLAHITKKEDVWDEIKLTGLSARLKKIYPLLEIEYHVIDRNEGLEESIENFVKVRDIHLISMSSSRRNIFARVFNPGIARRMLFHSDTPILVMKGM